MNLLTKDEHSMIEENNIIGKFDAHNIVTKDENFLTMFEIKGVSYSSKNDDEIKDYLNTRNNFFKSIDSMFNISIFQKRMKIDLDNTFKSKNIYAREMLEEYNKSNQSKTFVNKYFVSISTRNKNIKNFFQKKKDLMTTTKASNNNLIYLNSKLNDLSLSLLKGLAKYNIRRMTSSEVLNFYASYCNMKETNINAKEGLLRDNYISCNVNFYKDYIKHYDTEERFSRFITVKAYDTDVIDSNLTKDLINLPTNLMICENLSNISKDRTLSKLKDKIYNSTELVQDELNNLLQEVATDRETLIYYTLSVLVTENTLEKLEDTTKEVENIFSKYGLITLAENINLKTLYFSFFPSRDNLNARKRIQTSTSISVLNTFEKDFLGYDKNSFGNNYVAMLNTANHTPYKFNFHISDEDKALGNFIIIADTGKGKTTLISFLIACLTQYDINILAYDKLNGMYIVTKYLNGDYAEVNTEFALNPFSLIDSNENRAFLKMWLKEMAEIQSNDFSEVQAINEAIDMMYDNKGKEDILTFTDFLKVLPAVESLDNKFLPFAKGLFDNEKCVINFKNQLTVLAMDTILKDSKLASLTSMYISHKLKTVAKNESKGFFQFYDELKDHLHNEKTAQLILESIVEGRKINGTTGVAVQNLDFFDLVKNKDAILDGFGYFLVYPTSSDKSLKKLQEQLNLNESEVDFLKGNNGIERQVLLKNTKTKESIFLNIDLGGMKNFLKFLNSDADEVNRLKKLEKENPNNWRKEF
jgi:type IV secretion/conjugal transfer VirB4 family ATPase